MEIEGKVWGMTSNIFQKNNVKINRAVIKEGAQCSKHKHEHTHNMFFIERGEILLERWKNDYELIDKSYLHNGCYAIVPPGEYHQFTGIDDESIIYEIYWVHLEDDIIRETCGNSGE